MLGGVWWGWGCGGGVVGCGLGVGVGGVGWVCVEGFDISNLNEFVYRYMYDMYVYVYRCEECTYEYMQYIEMFGYHMPVTMNTKMNVYAYLSHIPKSHRLHTDTQNKLIHVIRGVKMLHQKFYFSVAVLQHWLIIVVKWTEITNFHSKNDLLNQSICCSIDKPPASPHSIYAINTSIGSVMYKCDTNL